MAAVAPPPPPLIRHKLLNLLVKLQGWSQKNLEDPAPQEKNQTGGAAQVSSAASRVSFNDAHTPSVTNNGFNKLQRMCRKLFYRKRRKMSFSNKSKNN